MASASLGDHLRGMGYLFYAISPNETSFETVEDLPQPDYLTRVLKKINNPNWAYPLFLKFVLAH